ncbi:transposase-like zinc-binding domain-containing protein [Collinsella sp. Sow4_D11]
MKAGYCPYCGGRAKRNGRTSSGSQRWMLMFTKKWSE